MKKLMLAWILFAPLAGVWAAGPVSIGLELELWNTEAGINFGSENVTAIEGIEVYDNNYRDREIHPALGVILQFGSAFVKLTRSAETEFDGDFFTTQFVDLPSPLGFDRVNLDGDFASRLDREDTDLSVGYAWATGLTVFGGYKEISFSEHFDLRTAMFTIESFDSEGVLFDSFDSTPAGFNWNITTTYDYDGPFVGLGYGKRLPGTSFSYQASVAYADLSTELVQRQTVDNFTIDFQAGEVVVQPGTQTPPEIRFDVDADGISVNLGLTYGFNSGFSVSVNYKRQDYSADSQGNIIPDLDSDGFALRLLYMF